MSDAVAALQAAPELAVVHPTVADDEAVLRLLGGLAVERGYARAGFAEALMARERSHPTGLPTPVPSAIPHADPHLILRPGIGLALLETPVPFTEMGSADRPVAVRLAVLLLVTDPADQITALTRVVTALQSQELATALDRVADANALAKRVGQLLG